MNATALALALLAVVIAALTRKEQKKQMDAIEQVEANLAELKSAIAIESDQVQAELQKLRDAIKSGATNERLLAIADDISAATARVRDFVKDEEPGENTNTVEEPSSETEPVTT